MLGRQAGVEIAEPLTGVDGIVQRNDKGPAHDEGRHREGPLLRAPMTGNSPFAMVAPVCSQNPILSKSGDSRRKAKSSRESLKWGDQNQTGQGSQGSLATRHRTVLICVLTANCSSASHIGDSEAEHRTMP